MNYYEVLEVSVNASKEVIKNAYRALSKKYHPDVYKGDKAYAEEKLKEINTAYEVLIDDNRRLLYDYDNGFKIDPNAPVEKEEEQVQYKSSNIKREDKSFKDEDEDKFTAFLKRKKGLVIAVISVAFILAFVIGILIARGDTTDSENNVETDSSNSEEDTTTTKNDYTYNNSNSNSNSNYSQKENTQKETPKTDTTQKPVTTQKEQEPEKDNEENTDIPVNSDDYGQS